MKKSKPKDKKIVIRKNYYNRFEEPNSHIVFDPSTKMAYGVQDHTNGRVYALSDKHIKICERNKWKYSVPEPEEESSSEESSEEESEEESSDEEESSEEESEKESSDEESSSEESEEESSSDE